MHGFAHVLECLIVVPVGSAERLVDDLVDDPEPVEILRCRLQYVSGVAAFELSSFMTPM